MAVIHQAQLTPSKLETIAAWLPAQPWCPPGATGPSGAAGDLEHVGAYRFDDPDGRVGVEVHLVRAAGALLQVPLTYRGAELPGARQWLAGTLEHSVLGHRWVYDALGDPVHARALDDVARGRARQAELVGPDGAPLPAPVVRVQAGPAAAGAPAAGAVSTATAGGVEVGVVRVLDGTAVAPPGAATLTGTWPGQREPVLLAWSR
ncbi:maltokinase N-terminal cap-like domain-containing protein [Kineococcus sp. SYSU DK005]|uniref:maltokinase N-terminal cap-like domain-containing protein n=1 Tax=Kineococcus sp. SYSU DK005 TaxID=3383126 RepID=UPI003D7CDCB8